MVHAEHDASPRSAPRGAHIGDAGRLGCRRGNRETPSETTVDSLLADPCSEVCSVNLCVVQGAIQQCPEMCPGDLRVALAAEHEVTLRLPFVGPEEVGCRALGREHGRHHVCATVFCNFIGVPCFPCRTDADCDDRNGCTTDTCVPTGRCEHSGGF